MDYHPLGPRPLRRICSHFNLQEDFDRAKSDLCASKFSTVSARLNAFRPLRSFQSQLVGCVGQLRPGIV